MTVSLTKTQNDAVKSKTNSASRIATMIKFLIENIDNIFKSKPTLYIDETEPVDTNTGFIWFKPTKDELKISLTVNDEPELRSVCTISNQTLLESQLAVTNRLTVLEEAYVN